MFHIPHSTSSSNLLIHLVHIYHMLPPILNFCCQKCMNWVDSWPSIPWANMSKWHKPPHVTTVPIQFCAFAMWYIHVFFDFPVDVRRFSEEMSLAVKGQFMMNMYVSVSEPGILGMMWSLSISQQYYGYYGWFLECAMIKHLVDCHEIIDIIAS